MLSTLEGRWRALLAGTDPTLPARRRRMRLLPGAPRCKTCHAPFGGIGGWWMERQGLGRWDKNPNYCRRCYRMFEDLGVGGAEVEVTILLADARGSTSLAETMTPTEFGRLMNRFYQTATDVLVHHDAIVDKFVGDEVVALFVPGMTGPGHARLAVDAARTLLRRTGHGAGGRPWLPLGVGVHTGTALVGLFGTVGGEVEFTALGDAVNTTARLVARAAAGEALVSRAAASTAGLERSGLEKRRLVLKGRTEPVDAVVVRP